MITGENKEDIGSSCIMQLINMDYLKCDSKRLIDVSQQILASRIPGDNITIGLSNEYAQIRFLIIRKSS